MSKLICASYLLFVILAVSCTEQQNDDSVAAMATLKPIGATLSASSTTTRILPPPATPSLPANNTVSPTAIATATRTPRPSPTATPSPLPTATPTALPTPPILLQMGSNGGDGGTIYDQYFGRGTPNLIVYTDGRLLRGTWVDIRARSYTESYLTEEQQCALLAEIAETGFLEIPFDGSSEEIYEFDETTQFSDGAGYQTILINGETPKGIHVYGPYMQYSISEVRMIYDLLENLNPPALPYQSESLLLWIETGVGQGYANSEEQITPTPWPADLPSLQALHGRRKVITYRTYDETLIDEGGEVLVSGEEVLPFWDFFGQKTNIGWFVEDGQLYLVVARLLLPHEQGVTWIPVEPYRFSLPFECAGD